MAILPPLLSEAERDDMLLRCEERIGYRFADRELLLAALTHASGAKTRLHSNERMEFLGDAILGLVVCEELYHNYPRLLEGELTRIKSAVVSRATCASISRELQLEEFLVLGKGMTTSAVIPRSLLADVFESLVAAIYLDGGMEPSARFIITHVGPKIAPVAVGDAGENYKSELQQLAQRDFARTPTYYLVNESGPDHNKSFQVAARIGDRTYNTAWGRSKKEAEQQAARIALEELADEADDPSA